MKTFKITSLGKENKSAYNAAGERVFVANRFRDTIKAGDYALVISKTFSSRTDDAGNVVECEPWSREEITAAGDLKSVVLAKHEATILAGVEAAIVAAATKEAMSSYSPAAELKAAAVNA